MDSIVTPARVQFPPKMGFLFERHRYKGAHSGRGPGKSWSFAQATALLGTDATINDWRDEPQPLRIVCARETQKSIKESVHQNLEDRIRSMGLGDYYTIQRDAILGVPHPDGRRTEFIFVGLRHNIDNIKSLEGADIVWVEEAQSVSKDSWNKLIPTVRKPLSEIWISWNPNLISDEVWQRFVIHQPPNSKVVKLSWRDNPWFPEVLDVERRHMMVTDPVGYRNVWEGEPRESVEGAIFEAEMKAAQEEGRIGSVARDRLKPVDTCWDLGYGDKMAVWFYQTIDGWIRFVDYQEEAGKTMEWWMVQLQQRGYLYGTHHLPWDGIDAEITNKKLVSGSRRSPATIMREAGFKVHVADKLLRSSQINIARTAFPQCQFDQDKCYEGLRALRMYQWGPPPDMPDGSKGLPGKEPLHDDASHGASAFQIGTQCAKQPKAPQKPQQQPARPVSAWA